MRVQGAMAIFIGSLQGIPYKTYAIQAAPIFGRSLLYFILVSIPARLIRFLGSVFCTHVLFSILLKNSSLPYKMGVLTLFWLVLYTVYFRKMYLWKKASS